jgi:phospholipid transport system substrate-binding protein
MMKHRGRTLWSVALLLSALWSQRVAWATSSSSPLEVIRSAVQQAREVLENPAYQDEAHRRERMEKVWAVIEPYFDLHELSQRTLGVYWRERTPEEQREFVRLFTALIKQTYSSALTRYTSDIQFAFDQERVEGNFAEVDTRLINPSLQKTIPMQYALHKVNGNWRIYDVVIENVSLVRNYRSQFNRILSHASYADLIEDIKKKIA